MRCDNEWRAILIDRGASPAEAEAADHAVELLYATEEAVRDALDEQYGVIVGKFERGRDATAADLAVVEAQLAQALAGRAHAVKSAARVAGL